MWKAGPSAKLANLFGTYVPPELVDEMVKDPDSYSMKASAKELTVMFCDMRGFTKMSETMEPTQLQALLNSVFSRLTDLIRGNRGTIDKYMGDCVMAFWGAPVDTPEHASPGGQDVAGRWCTPCNQLNEEHRAKGMPEIGIGVGLNTGSMCVGRHGFRHPAQLHGDWLTRSISGRVWRGCQKLTGWTRWSAKSTRKLAHRFCLAGA